MFFSLDVGTEDKESRGLLWILGKVKSGSITVASPEYNVDAFKFGEAFHLKYPREWKTLEKNWDTEFKNLQVKVNVESKLRPVGLNAFYDED